jgi:hypothetical protein
MGTGKMLTFDGDFLQKILFVTTYTQNWIFDAYLPRNVIVCEHFH